MEKGLDDGGNSINHPMPINACDLANKQSLWLALLCNQTVTRFDILFHN